MPFNASRNPLVFNQNSKTTLLDGYGTVDGTTHAFTNVSFSGGTIAYAGTAGAFTLLLDQQYNCDLGGVIQVYSPNSRSGLKAEVVFSNVTGAVDALGNPARTIKFVFLNGTTPTELPAGAGFSVVWFLKDSANKPGS